MKICGKNSVARSIARAMAILLLALAPGARAATYYSQPPFIANALTNWNSNPAGSGSAPANFTSGDTFIIQTNHMMTNGNTWTVSGGATIQINSGGILDGCAKSINVGGNLVNNGTIQGLLIVGATIYSFTGASTYSGTGVIAPGTGGSSRISWQVGAGNTLTMGANFLFANTGVSHRTFTVSGTIDCGAYALTGGSGIDFMLTNSATIITAHTNGLNGSIVNFGTFSSFSSAASYVFNGASAQVAGSSLPAMVTNLTINNPAGVTLAGNVTVMGSLTLTNSSRLNLRFTTGTPVTAGKLVSDGTTTLGILGTNFVAGQDYPAIQYTNRQGSGGIVLGPLPAGMVATLITNGSSLVLRVVTPPAVVVTPPLALMRDVGGMHLGINSVTGYTYKVSASTNLVVWEHLASLRGQDVVPWTLPAAELGYAQRYFRADKVVGQGQSGLTRWTNFQATAGARLQIGFIGDSYTQNRSRYTKRLKQTLAAQYGNLGAGFLGFASFSAAGLNGSVDETELDYTIAYTNWTTKNGSGYGPDAGHVTSVSNNASLTISVKKTVETNKLYYVKSPGTAGFQYRIRNAATTNSWVTNSTDAALALGLTAIDCRTNIAPYYIDLEALGVGVSLIGAEAIKTGPGVVAHKLGCSGGRAEQFAANAVAKAALNELNLDLIIIMFATNEQGGNATPASFKIALQNIITTVRSVKPGIDVILMLPCYTQYELEIPKAYKLHDYGKVMLEVAAANNAAFIDFSDVFGPATELQHLIDAGLMAADRVHPSTTGVGSGGYLMADTIAKSLLNLP